MSSLRNSYNSLTKVKTSDQSAQEIAARVGNLFSTELEADILTTDSVSYIMTVGDISTLELYESEVQTDSGELKIEIFSEPVYTGGSPLPIRRRNLAIDNSALSAILGSPTVSNDGVLEYEHTLFGDNASSRSSAYPTNEILILEGNKTYHLKVTHNGAGTRFIHYDFTFAENK